MPATAITTTSTGNSDGPFVFIPWGVDDVFHLKDDPNPFDNISDPPPSVLALTAIPNRLYNNADWRMRVCRSPERNCWIPSGSKTNCWRALTKWRP